jgi:hypothetical protein
MSENILNNNIQNIYNLDLTFKSKTCIKLTYEFKKIVNIKINDIDRRDLIDVNLMTIIKQIYNCNYYSNFDLYFRINSIYINLFNMKIKSKTNMYNSYSIYDKTLLLNVFLIETTGDIECLYDDLYELNIYITKSINKKFHRDEQFFCFYNSMPHIIFYDKNTLHNYIIFSNKNIKIKNSITKTIKLDIYDNKHKNIGQIICDAHISNSLILYYKKIILPNLTLNLYDEKKCISCDYDMNEIIKSYDINIDSKYELMCGHKKNLIIESLCKYEYLYIIIDEIKNSMSIDMNTKNLYIISYYYMNNYISYA